MPASRPSAVALAQELRDRLSLQLVPSAVLSESLQQTPDGGAVYVVDAVDQTALSRAVRQSCLIVLDQHQGVEITAEGVDLPDGHYRATMTVRVPAITASIHWADAKEVVAVALQVGEHLFGIASDSAHWTVLRDGDEIAKTDSPAEAFGALVSAALPDFLTLLHPTQDVTDETKVQVDQDVLTGLLPGLLRSPAVQGKAADLLIKFYETAAQRTAPEVA